MTESVTVREAMKFEPPPLLVTRFSEEHRMSESETRELFEELKKFLSVAATFSGPAMKFAPNKKVDEMWHLELHGAPHALAW